MIEEREGRNGRGEKGEKGEGRGKKKEREEGRREKCKTVGTSRRAEDETMTRELGKNISTSSADASLPPPLSLVSRERRSGEREEEGKGAERVAS